MSREMPRDITSLPADAIEKVTIHRVTSDSKETAEDVVVREFQLAIILNGQKIVTLLCTPADLKYLALGYLYSEGLLTNRTDVKRVTVSKIKGEARVTTKTDMPENNRPTSSRIIASGGSKIASNYSATDTRLRRVKSKLTVSTAQIFMLMEAFQQKSPLFQITGGVHSAAICDRNNILIFSEDIGRHNAIDKVFGQCFDKNIPVKDAIILTSGRVSSEIVGKVARRQVPVLISVSAPTGSGIKLAQELGITLVGFVRGTRMNVYTHDGRVTTSY